MVRPPAALYSAAPAALERGSRSPTTRGPSRPASAARPPAACVRRLRRRYCATAAAAPRPPVPLRPPPRGRSRGD